MNTEPIPAKKTSRLVRGLRWVALLTLGLITIVALFYAVENYRGKKAWDRYAQGAAQRGMVFDFLAHVPPPVPDDQNAANIPLIHAWFDPRLGAKGDPTLWPDLHARADRLIASDKDKSKRRLTDLVAWQEALANAESNAQAEKIRRQSHSSEEQARAATNVLAALQVYEPALEQLREGMKRPHVRYPVDYQTDTPFSILLPHLANVRTVGSLLALRASAYLASGNSNAALQDVLVAVWLVESLENEHFLISYLVRIACLQTAAQPIWEGMVQHRWNEAQLKTLQERVSQLDFLRGLQRALETERAAGLTTIDWIKQRRSGQRFEALGETETIDKLSPGGVRPISLLPRGWWDLEKVNYARIFESVADPISAAIASGTFSNATETTAAGRKPRHGLAAFWHHEIMAALLLPALDKVQRKGVMGQVLVDEIVVACALERARLASGVYPPNLDALTLKFLSPAPRDVMTGQPFNYRSEGDGYVLYSVGWNRKDDAGTPGKALFDDQQGDWVWRISVP